MNNEYIYLSNLLWEKATATSLFPKKDLSSMEYPLSLYLNNELVTYNKGLGMHANSEIIFDIKNLNCSKFEAQIGLQSNNALTTSKVKFIIKADEITVFESSIIDYRTSQYININISSTSKLTLITQSTTSDVNGCDAIWADAKLLYEKTKPINYNYIFKFLSNLNNKNSFTINNNNIYLQNYENKINQLFQLSYDKQKCAFTLIDICNKDNLLGIDNNNNLSFDSKDNLKYIWWQFININDQNYIISSFDCPNLVLELSNNNSTNSIISLNNIKNLNDPNISNQLFEINFLNLFNPNNIENIYNQLYHNSSLSDKKLYKIKNKSNNNLLVYNNINRIFYMDTLNINSNTLFQFNYIPLENSYKIKCLYTEQQNSSDNLVLDIKENLLAKYINVSNDENSISQFWNISEFNENFFTISNKKYKNLTLTLNNGILTLNSFDNTNLNDNQLFIIEEL